MLGSLPPWAGGPLSGAALIQESQGVTMGISPKTWGILGMKLIPSWGCPPCPSQPRAPVLGV